MGYGTEWLLFGYQNSSATLCNECRNRPLFRSTTPSCRTVIMGSLANQQGTRLERRNNSLSALTFCWLKLRFLRMESARPCRLVRNASEVSIGTPPPSVELGGPGWRCCLWQTRNRDRRLGRTSSMICTQAPDPCSQNRAV